MSSPSAGKPSETGLIGSVIATERKQAPTSVPPDRFTIGTRPRPTRSCSHRYGSGFHGSPVVAIACSEERSPSGSPFGMSARISVGETPSIVTRSASTVRQSRSSGQSGAPSAKTIDAPTAPPPTTVHGPHDPAHVGGEVDPLALVHVRLVRDLAGDRDEEAALHVKDALRLARRAGRVRQQVRVLRVDLERRQLPGLAADELRPRLRLPLPRDHVAVADDLVERLAHLHPPAPAQRPVGADHDLRLRRLEPLAHGRRGEPGEDRDLHGPDVRARVRGDRDLRAHRHEDRDAVARLDAELDERLGELRRLARELGPRALAARAVLAEEHGRRLVRASAPPSGARSSARCSPARRRTTSPTRSRARCRARAPTGARTRARGRRRPRARTARAPRSRSGAAPRSARPRSAA